MRKLVRWFFFVLLLGALDDAAQKEEWKSVFKNPPAQYKTMPFWHMNGKLTNEGIDSEMRDMKYKSNFGGVTVLPVSAQAGFGSNKIYPGMEPAYLSDEYFTFYKRILDNVAKLGMRTIWYDDLDFPSGSAGGRMKKLYPGDTRKVLSKKDTVISGVSTIEMDVPVGKLMAAVAMETGTKKRIDIGSSVTGSKLKWNVPAGEWKVMLFTCDTVNSNMANDIAVDYLDPDAIAKYVKLNNEEFARRYKVILVRLSGRYSLMMLASLH